MDLEVSLDWPDSERLMKNKVEAKKTLNNDQRHARARTHTHMHVHTRTCTPRTHKHD